MIQPAAEQPRRIPLADHGRPCSRRHLPHDRPITDVLENL